MTIKLTEHLVVIRVFIAFWRGMDNQRSVKIEISRKIDIFRYT